ncbi:hypothetical protein [Rhizobium hainanense]|uniref:Aromatic ring-opening dioxygenase LigA n=1 Tax=Rhizobium hainanense TaxID=52131 RepID=A0A1C3VAV6_9HYPH|nr:hypothetical protein [Rhizobium hainanense]SCB24883.1 hypothetical protein GA0061100_105166 [Rhizobium hainanense]
MVTENIKLNFTNRSGDTNNSSVLIFQQNVAESFGEIAVAWKVIRNCGRLDTHPFNFPLQFQVSAKDSWGNYTPQLTAYDGQAFDMTLDNSGDVLSVSKNSATSPNEVEVRNQLKQGAISACIFKDGKLLATKTNMAPGQKAVFQFQPRIYIGVVSQVTEGQIINSAIISQVNTEINLFGITSANIVMTGGGPGPNSSPFEFHLENINQ